ncbi:hypothetical protein H312_03359 [Anncaliia algerae PRA339]|uniref:ISXO2-like transposase domain-containing protein n=1 Tax=Anncaliia algerae PRA339 TaxID=1288291 RepID=A0A059EWX9_9MICR|nr:hypothetical protein H312_03359 [Anncaliia algerae PRA339]
MIEGNTRSKKTCGLWYKKLSLQTFNIMKTLKRDKIGGIGNVIEVDESRFSKGKYNVTKVVRSPWILGGMDLETGDVFFAEEINRNMETINNILLENIELDNTIVTDSWREYVEFNQLGFIHLTVNDSENFIDPLTGANTQAIENRWSIYKKILRVDITIILLIFHLVF